MSKVVLAVDPGALRLGYSIIERDHLGFRLVISGTLGLARKDNEKFQVYKKRLLEYWWHTSPLLLKHSQVDEVVFEQVPAVGGGNFVGPQSELVKMVVTILQLRCIDYGLSFREITARTIKKNLTGNSRATKVQIRNAVIAAFPELEPRKAELTQTADESDAIGIGLVAQGYKVKVSNGKARTRKASTA
jgi:Holliday junction resolvasome RuvABC endonuclease subunit